MSQKMPDERLLDAIRILYGALSALKITYKESPHIVTHCDRALKMALSNVSDVFSPDENAQAAPPVNDAFEEILERCGGKIVTVKAAPASGAVERAITEVQELQKHQSDDDKWLWETILAALRYNKQTKKEEKPPLQPATAPQE